MRIITLIAICWCSPVAAQPANSLPASPVAKAAIDAASMYEDIEILCRTLARAIPVRPGHDSGAEEMLAGYHRRHDLLLGSGYASTSRGTMKFSGVYLPGTGVVLTADVPTGTAASAHGLINVASCTRCHQSIDVPKPKVQPARLSHWEKMRKQLRGEPIPKAKKTPPMQVCKPGTMSYRIIEQLRQHGHNMKQLPGGESITVVVTVPAGASARLKSSLTGTELIDVTTQVAANLLQTVDNEVTLADLHLRNKKYDLAIKAYEKAIKAIESTKLPAGTSDPFAPETSSSPTQKVKKTYADVAQKLAKAYLDSGQTESALVVLNKRVRGLKMATLPAAKNPAPAARPTLPGKMILRVGKADLLAAKQKKLSMDAFAKKVTIQTVNFPRPKAAKKSPK